MRCARFGVRGSVEVRRLANSVTLCNDREDFFVITSGQIQMAAKTPTRPREGACARGMAAHPARSGRRWLLSSGAPRRSWPLTCPWAPPWPGRPYPVDGLLTQNLVSHLYEGVLGVIRLVNPSGGVGPPRIGIASRARGHRHQGLRRLPGRRIIIGLGAVVADEARRLAIGEPAIAVHPVRVPIPALCPHETRITRWNLIAGRVPAAILKAPATVQLRWQLLRPSIPSLRSLAVA
jgi:hypothetical protein